MTYLPNFNDPRVRSRCKQALGFSLAVLSPTKPHQWSTRFLDKWFGRCDTDISIWLRGQLLVVVDNKWRIGEQCKSYCLNESGSDRLIELLAGKSVDIPTNIPSELVKQELVDNWCGSSWRVELNSGDFAYRDIKNRLWHPLQNIKNEHRTRIFKQNGYFYNYDIQCASATLIYWYGQDCGASAESLDGLLDYIQNRDYHRTRLANLIGCDVSTAKVIITSLLCGARLGCSPLFSIYQLLGKDKNKIQLLKQDKWLRSLRASNLAAWRAIEPHYMTKYSKTNRRIPMSASGRWSVYFMLERRVLDTVRNYLSMTNNRCFLEHDGWRTQDKIKEHELNQFLLDNLGFTVKLDSES